jgi:hypothetical protein
MERVTMAQVPVIRIDSGKIELRADGSCVTLSDDLFLAEAPGIRLDARKKNVKFNGSSVLEFK